MIVNSFQKRAYDAVAQSLPFGIDDSKVEIRPGPSYARSTIKIHDYAAGVMAAYGSVVERLGTIRGLPAQTMKLDRRRCGLLLNSPQLQFLNGYGTLMDTWPVGPDNGTYRAKDGRHVTIIGLHPHLRDGLLNYFQCANTAAAIQSSVEKKTSQQIEDELAELRLPAGIVRSPGEWLAHPQGHLVANRPLIEIEESKGDMGRRLGPARRRPLEGVRVLELTHLVAGPTMGRLLAEQGADVIKVQPPMGDWVLPLWLDVNWGKKSILLDVKSLFGKSRFVQLLANADVLINSNSPGSLDRLGLTQEALRKINPGLVVANASYAPPNTPWASRRGFEQIGQAVSGMMHIHSADLPDPTVVSVLINDYLTGNLGAIGIIAALCEREERGGFWNVHVSLQRCATMATTLLERQDAEPYAPVTLDDLLTHAVDQETPIGVFTRLASAVEFSHAPSWVRQAPSIPGVDPDTTGWDTPSSYEQTTFDIPHFPSRMVREGRIRNFLSSYGIEDRGDGGGGMSLASKALFEAVLALRAMGRNA
ncbi:CoA transferase [Dyella sp. EPa41]|uniref:CoA transferase n=1 Tax=Dyella sp. EPa41 TaxID=1561194 RepID=UPI001916A192|nr:CoA transferase [Dyella sp. EPa41]